MSWPRFNLRLRFLLVLLPVTLAATLGMGLVARGLFQSGFERSTREALQSQLRARVLPLTTRMHTLEQQLKARRESLALPFEADEPSNFDELDPAWSHDAKLLLEGWIEIREVFLLRTRGQEHRLHHVSRDRSWVTELESGELPYWLARSSADVAARIVPGKADLRPSLAVRECGHEGAQMVWMSHRIGHLSGDSSGLFGILLSPSAFEPFLAPLRDDGRRVVLEDLEGRRLALGDSTSTPMPRATNGPVDVFEGEVSDVTWVKDDEGRKWMVARHQDAGLGLMAYYWAPETELMAELVEFDRIIAVLMIAALILNTVLILGLACRVAEPLERMSAAMAEVAGGDLTRRIEVRGEDEIGRVSRAFNAMIADLHTTHVALRAQSARLATALQEVEDVEAMKDSFLALVSHEVRTPLTSIMGGVEFLREEFGDRHDDTEREFMTIVYDSAKRLAGFMNDAIMMASLQASRNRTGFETFSLTALVHSKVESVDLTRAPEGVRVENRMNLQREFFVLGDWTLLQVALEKVLVNAAQHNVPGGEVVVELVERVLEDPDGDLERMMLSRGMEASEQAAAWRAVRVFNSGPLIPPDKVAGLFSRFELTHDISNHQRGSGLSLPIAQYVMNYHGGIVEVRNVAEHGMAFYLVLPGRLSLQARNNDVELPPGIDETVAAARLVEAAQAEVDRIEAGIEAAELGTPTRFSGEIPRYVNNPFLPEVSEEVPTEERQGSVEETLIGADAGEELPEFDPSRE